MPTKKDAQPDPRSSAYDAAISEYAEAIAAIQSGNYEKARKMFQALTETKTLDEPELLERAATYLRVCDQRQAPPVEAPASDDDRFYHAVLLSNDGSFDEALSLLNQVLANHPDSVRSLYARASVQALKGQADAAVTDLRQAIAADPKVRFQAVNDPDFEKIREEPAFIDIIEPTPSGA